MALAELQREIEQALEKGNLDSEVATRLRSLLATVQETTRHIEFRQLSNAGDTATTTLPAYLQFFLPLQGAGPNEYVELRVYYRQGKGKQIDPDDVRLAFLLEMQAIGTVVVKLDIFRQHVRAAIETAHAEVEQLFRAMAPQLRSRLHTLGYVVDALNVARTQRPALEGEAPPPPATSLHRVDVSV